jgi:cobalt-precorrin 5A hydrolase/precorrin-3B C17-methyltransferase
MNSSNIAPPHHPGTVFFIGAGPGAPDLITVRGQDIIAQADLILYADSLVQESVTHLARKPGARVAGSSGMHLEQMVELMVEVARAGGVVARVHTGDPALYGAIQEQIAGLEAAGIACEIVPGVTAAFAAAARLGASLTLPEVTQTLILSRVAGRTPVPEQEALPTLAAHGASLVLYLSVAQIEQVVETALASGGYTPHTPVAVVHKVTWPDEHMVVGTLADIVARVREAGYTRHALIIISPALAHSSPPASRLYDRSFAHGFRGSDDAMDDDATEYDATGGEATGGKATGDMVIVAVTRAGSQLAARLAQALQADTVLPARFASESTTTPYDGSALQAVRRCWSRYRRLLLVMASGIAVRAIAPLLGSKTRDPAVVCMDEAGRSVIPLIGGHRAGANALAHQVAAITGGHAAITTASDVQGKPSLDLLGHAEGWSIDPASALTHASACLVNDQPIGVYVEPALQAAQQQVQTWVGQADNLVLVERLDELATESYAACIIVTHRPAASEGYRHLLHKSVVVYPPLLVVGMGCREGASADELRAALETTLMEHGVVRESVATIATITLKAKEAGLHRMAESLGIPLRFIDEPQVRAIDAAQLSDLSAASTKLGLPGVAEPCALIASGGGVLLGPRRKFAHCTVALALVTGAQQGRLALVSIGPGDTTQMTIAARDALQAADVVVGYRTYIDLVRPLLSPEQEIIAGPMRQERQRAEQALDMAAAGQRVALVSSGDVGMYGMAGPVYEVLRQREWQGSAPLVETYPGVSAFQAAAARVGAPINHDVCIISLSDLLTDWAVIEQRLVAAARADFVVALYNPRSRKRDWQLARARDILLAERPSSTPVAVVNNVTRADESVTLTTLAELEVSLADMKTVVIVGSSQSYMVGGQMATPRGYITPSPSSSPSPSSHARIVPPASPLPAYPITLTRLHHTLALVVGGGAVGERKIRGLLDAGIPVRLISPAATPQVQTWAEEGSIEWIPRSYHPDDMAHDEAISLVFAATDQREVNRQVAQEADEHGVLCNVADAPHEGTFHVPAVYRGQGVMIAVSTMGKSPARAAHVRDRLAEILKHEG